MSVIEALVCPECGEKKYIELDNGDYKCSCCNLLFFKVELSEQHKLNRAQLDLSIYKFEDANNIYAELLKETKDEKTKVMCYYGMLLAYFGVKYIKDINNKLIVTFSNYYPNISSIKDIDYYNKIRSSSYYEKYQEKLNKLDQEYKHIKEELDKKSEYDVFICVKVTESKNRHTEDSINASRIYNNLVRRGLKVFYSEESLSGIKYDAQIYSALMRSDNILVISSSKECLESNWVKSEWKRWLNFIEAKKKKENSFYLYLLNKDVQVPLELASTQRFTRFEDFIDKLIENCKDNKHESVDELLNKARNYVLHTRYSEAEKIYMTINEKYQDYRAWLGLMDILIEKGVKIKDKRYINFYNKVISLCKDDVIKEDIKSKYQKYLGNIEKKEVAMGLKKEAKQVESVKSHSEENIINKPILSIVKKEESRKTYITGEIITLGKYPQTRVSSTMLIKILNNISKTNKLGYIEYEGIEYKKEGEKYFKVEPIEWIVLESNNETYKLLSKMILDVQCFDTSKRDVRKVNGKIIFENNYEYSKIRAWLNGYNGSRHKAGNYKNKGFIDIAFTKDEKNLINTTLVDNSLLSTGDLENYNICNNTKDKIYLLSYKEVTNPSYGFTNSYDKTTTRKALGTDYAKEKRLHTYYAYSRWWLRSPSYISSNNARYVSSDGNIGFTNVNNSNDGVRVALEITIK